MTHKLYTITSMWISTDEGNSQNLNSIIVAKSETDAILEHTQYGDGKWPKYLHNTAKLVCTDISHRARAFVDQYG